MEEKEKGKAQRKAERQVRALEVQAEKAAAAERRKAKDAERAEKAEQARQAAIAAQFAASIAPKTKANTKEWYKTPILPTSPSCRS